MPEDNAQKPPLDKIAQASIEEARMVLPGIQAIFGFQLMALFNAKFADLPFVEQHLHYVAILLLSVAIALIMAPAAYHRQAEPGYVSEFFVRLASAMIAVAMLPVMTALCLEVYIAGFLILGDPMVSAAVAGVLFIGFAGLWYAFPLLARHRPLQNGGRSPTATASKHRSS